MFISDGTIIWENKWENQRGKN